MPDAALEAPLLSLKMGRSLSVVISRGGGGICGFLMLHASMAPEMEILPSIFSHCAPECWKRGVKEVIEFSNLTPGYLLATVMSKLSRIRKWHAGLFSIFWMNTVAG